MDLEYFSVLLDVRVWGFLTMALDNLSLLARQDESTLVTLVKVDGFHDCVSHSCGQIFNKSV
jgi:hypothetical protein